MALERYSRENQGVRLTKSNLPFFLEGASLEAAPKILQTNKDVILKDFLKGFKQVNAGVPELKSMTKDQLKMLLREWNSTTPDSLGAEYGDLLAQELDKNIFTGAGLAAAFDNAMAKEGISDIKNVSERYAAEAQKILELISDRLEVYMSTLKGLQEPALLEKVLETYELTGKPIVDPDLKNYNSWQLTPQERARLSQKLSSNIEKLKEIIQELNTMSKGEAVSTKDGIKKPKTLLKSASSCFGTLGGEGIHEVIGEHSANLIKVRGKQEVVDRATMSFQQAGWKVTATSNSGQNVGLAEGKMKGQQKKPDINIYWDMGGVVIELPVSMKMRQSEQNYNFKTGQTKGAVSAQNIALGELLAMTLHSRASTAWYEKGLSAILDAPRGDAASLKADYIPFEESWQEFKEASKYVALFRSFVGTGIDGDDFATLFVVNDTVYSMYDILDQVDNNSVVRWGTSYWGKDLGIPSFSDMVKKVGGSYREGSGNIPSKNEIAERQQEELNAIKSLWNKKITIELQLTNLARTLR